MKILITGGSGYLAKILATKLESSGHEVFLGTRAEKVFQVPSNLNIKTRIMQWGKRQTVERACEGVQIVIQAAGLGAAESDRNPEKAMLVNGEYTGLLARSAKSAGATLFIYLSTVHVYSNRLEVALEVQSPPVDEHPYAKSHALGENLALLEETSEFKVCVLRLGNVFGAPIKEFGNSSGLVVHDFAQQAILTGKIEIKAPSETSRYFVPARYVSKLVENMIGSPSTTLPRIINVTWPNPMTLLAVAKEIGTLVFSKMGMRPKIFELSESRSSVPPLQICSKTAAEICAQTPEDFEQELSSLVDFIGRGD